MERFSHDIKVGLTDEQVFQRKEENLQNKDSSTKTKTIPRIFCENTFTLFNFLNIGLGLLILLTGSIKNLLFLGVVFCNTSISIIQEIRSKKVIDKLSLIASTKAAVIRNSKKEQIPLEELVLDDIVCYEMGSQVVVDSVLLDGVCEVNEAFLTGEVEPILKKKGDTLLSGSFLVSGQVVGYVDHIGNENYTSIISNSAKKIQKVDSEMMISLKKLIKVISICIVPLGCLLFYHQLLLSNYDWNGSIIHTVAALIGMIPEGLILLTSTVLAVSVIRLSKENVLVQELYSIESLAYVDVLCLDKTGTLTEGAMKLEKVISMESNMEESLTKYVSSVPLENETLKSIKEKYGNGKPEEIQFYEPFSSARKWALVTFQNGESYVLGAPEKLLSKETYEKIKPYQKEYRVLAFCSSFEKPKEHTLPNSLKELGIILLADQIRPTAKSTLEYFKKQGVTVKLISGDSVETVSSIAKKVGITGLGVDTSSLKEEEIKEASLKYTIFGRVTPDMKQKLVHALKEQNHKVAMTGDGVNDVLALKEADCSIAMNSGTDAARSVSELVLLDSNFDALPKVLEEGRRTINNIERSASLFLVKTIYASVLAFSFALLPLEYPFDPIQMSLTSMFTIGIPSFILALEPNHDLVKGNFLKNVLKKALPTALAIIIHILLIAFLSPVLKLSPMESSTLCVFAVGYFGFLLLYHICTPFNLLRRILYGTIIIGYLLGFHFLRELYSLSPITWKLLLYMGVILLLGFVIFEWLYYLYLKWIKKDD